MGDIFLKLLNMSITASWLVLAILVVRLLFGKMPKWMNCLLWGVVAIRLLVPFSVESMFSLQPSAEPIRTSTVAEGKILPYVPSVDSNLSFIENAVNPMLRDIFAYEASDSAAPLQVFTEVAGGIWLLGMLALLCFAFVSTVRLHFTVREAVCCKEDVYLCDAVKTPFILGVIRPKIYLPSALTEGETVYILAHERAHLQRLDHLWKPVGYLILCVYWFNPLLILAYVLLCKDIELACDEKVIKDMSFDDRKEYSRVLLSCATQRRFVLACPLAFGEVGVKDRVKSVLNHKKAALGISILAVLICAVIALCFLTNPAEKYPIRITIPAGHTEGFCYSDVEICPRSGTLVIAGSGELGDTEAVLLPTEGEEGAVSGKPFYITPGLLAKTEAEKGTWYRIGVNVQNPTEKDMDVYVSVRNVVVRIASEEQADTNSSLYGEIIAGLGDDDTYALLAMDYEYDVLLTTDLIYDEGTEPQAAVYCDVYYYVDGGAKLLGTVMSEGTAYPISFAKDGIYAASDHKIEKYAISQTGALYLQKAVYEQFDETGNALYTGVTDGQECEATEQDYREMTKEYGESRIVHSFRLRGKRLGK